MGKTRRIEDEQIRKYMSGNREMTVCRRKLLRFVWKNRNVYVRESSTMPHRAARLEEVASSRQVLGIVAERFCTVPGICALHGR